MRTRHASKRSISFEILHNLLSKCLDLSEYLVITWFEWKGKFKHFKQVTCPSRVIPYHRSNETNFNNRVPQIRRKFHPAFIQVVIRWLIWIFAHGSTAVLSWHVQTTCSEIIPHDGVTLSVMFHQIWITMENCLWNGPRSFITDYIDSKLAVISYNKADKCKNTRIPSLYKDNLFINEFSL